MGSQGRGLASGLAGSGGGLGGRGLGHLVGAQEPFGLTPQCSQLANPPCWPTQPHWTAPSPLGKLVNTVLGGNTGGWGQLCSVHIDMSKRKTCSQPLNAWSKHLRTALGATFQLRCGELLHAARSCLHPCSSRCLKLFALGRWL